MSLSSVQDSVSHTFAANRATGHIALGVAKSGGLTRRTRVHEDGSLRVRFPNAVAGGARSRDRQHRRRHDRRRPLYASR